jgi:hypothetical protein
MWFKAGDRFMAITPMSFDAAMKLGDGRGNIHLLLGNGFSIALKPNIFSYGSLFENADFSDEPEIARLFGVLETQDFEIAIRHLKMRLGSSAYISRSKRSFF